MHILAYICLQCIYIGYTRDQYCIFLHISSIVRASFPVSTDYTQLLTGKYKERCAQIQQSLYLERVLCVLPVNAWRAGFPALILAVKTTQRVTRTHIQLCFRRARVLTSRRQGDYPSHYPAKTAQPVVQCPRLRKCSPTILKITQLYKALEVVKLLFMILIINILGEFSVR